MQTKNAHTLVRIERHPKKKAYMKLHTSCGDLNLELHCDMAPRTCENFLVLSESGYYRDTIFHRCIKNFMIQVGLHNRDLHCRRSSISGTRKSCASAD